MKDAKKSLLNKLTYREFVQFMKRYNNEYRKKNEEHKSPYKYTRVFK